MTNKPNDIVAHIETIKKTDITYVVTSSKPIR